MTLIGAINAYACGASSLTLVGATIHRVGARTPITASNEGMPRGGPRVSMPSAPRSRKLAERFLRASSDRVFWLRRVSAHVLRPYVGT